MNKDDYEYVENLVNIFFAGDECEKSDALKSIVEAFKPLIVKLMMRYFGRFDEDLLQGAIVELIERTIDYDYENYNRFAAYTKTFMELYFKRIYYKNIGQNDIPYDDIYLNDISQNDVYDVEVESIIDSLEGKEKHIIKKNIIENQKLNLVAEEMNISYVYAKKLKKSALKRLKSTF